MTLMKYRQPEIDVFGKRFSDFIDEFFENAVVNHRDTFIPKMDVSEDENQYEIQVQLPGIKKEDISLDLEDGHLKISGKREFKKEEKDKRFHRVESEYGSFARSLQLPDNIDPDSVKAAYNNGILMITIQKTEDKVKKQISIK